jgi:hypothetical protein
MENADEPFSIEYILGIHENDHDKINTEDSKPLYVVNKERYCSVDNWNEAADCSTGKIIILNADDFFPPPHWDYDLLKVIPDINAEFAVHVTTDKIDPVHCNMVMTLGIMSRALYERWGYALHREYEAGGSDLDFTEHAYQDGVVIQAKHLLFQHKHPLLGYGEYDTVYRHQNRPASYEHDGKVLQRRRRIKFKE